MSQQEENSKIGRMQTLRIDLEIVVRIAAFRDTTFPRATLARNVFGEGEGARKCRF